MDDDVEELDPVYVVWESGGFEEFPCAEDARHEMMAMGSRGLRGELFEDIFHAVLYLGNRLDVQLIARSLANDHRPEVREFAGKYPEAWDALHPVSGFSALLLHNGERKQEFRLLIYDSKENTVNVTESDLIGLPDLLKKKLTKTGTLEDKVRWLQAEVDRLRPLEEGYKDLSGRLQRLSEYLQVILPAESMGWDTCKNLLNGYDVSGKPITKEQNGSMPEHPGLPGRTKK